MSLQFIIDGYNITHHPEFARLANKKIRDSRLALLDLIKLKKLCGSPNNSALVIFDGYPDPSIDLEEKSIEVIFSKHESADERIRRLVELSANPKNIVVVSDDKEISLFIKAIGAKKMTVEEFLASAKKRADPEEPEITYSAMHKINEELRKLWLK
ncbi:MAG: NYN domain-containing protein [Candidatus Omnitrophica bacterium]|nr:NYN domain-containing protein [Candidatus Omnitrophota bacterium]